MKNRCANPRVRSYRDYGARGIRVCDRWRDSFEHFLADMGAPPTPQHEIDRIDNDGHYEPGNCRWVTSQRNRDHRRNTIYLTVDGETATLMEWARRVGLKQGALYYRVVLKGWDHARAVRTPLRRSA